jgi:hypothetical protein
MNPKVPIFKHAVATNEQNLKTLYDAGVKIGFGTDSGATPLRIPGFAEHRELYNSWCRAGSHRFRP